MPADDLDVLVLGRIYDRRRSTGATEPVGLDGEPVLVDRFLRGVTVGARLGPADAALGQLTHPCPDAASRQGTGAAVTSTVRECRISTFGLAPT